MRIGYLIDTNKGDYDQPLPGRDDVSATLDAMIEEGILEGDIILVQEQKVADNGSLIVATIDNEATVKRFYVHNNNKVGQQIELRPANSAMDSFWYSPDDVHIRGVVVGLIRNM